MRDEKSKDKRGMSAPHTAIFGILPSIVVVVMVEHIYDMFATLITKLACISSPSPRAMLIYISCHLKKATETGQDITAKVNSADSQADYLT